MMLPSAAYVLHHDRVELTDATELRFEHPLKRRMSSLQAAVMEVVDRLKVQRPQLFQDLLTSNAPIYFATPYGELHASLTVTESIYRNTLPCSPTAFQHSVHNCAPAYVSMASQIHSPCITISCDNLSFDKALYFAFAKIRTRQATAVMVIHGAELLCSGESSKAEAEIVVIGSDVFADHHEISFQLQSFAFAADDHDVQPIRSDLDPALPQRLWRETADPQPTKPISLNSEKESFHRLINSRDGEWMISTWRFLQ